MKRDNELLAKVEAVMNKTNLLEEDKAAINSLIGGYKSATYEEYEDRHRFYRNNVERMINDFGFESDKLAEERANDHPTLQQTYMRHCMKFIKLMAEKEYFDGRNESSVKLAKRIMDAVKDDVFLPMI